MKGNECYRAGEYEEAYACYSRSLAYDDSNAVVYANRAVVSLRMDHFESAEEDCSRAIALNSNYTKAYSRRGNAKMRLGKYGEVSGRFRLECQSFILG